MARITLDITMSLDGFVAGPEPSMEDPLGKRGEELHEWVFGLASWRQAHGMEGGETGPDADLVAEHVASYGAVVMGRRMYSGGAGPWEGDPNAGGWWGDDPPFHVPVFVLTHHPRESREMQGGTTSTSSPTGSIRRSTGPRGLPETRPSMWRVEPTSSSRRSTRAGSTSSRCSRARAARRGHAALRERRRQPREARADAHSGVAGRHAPALPGRQVARASGMSSRWASMNVFPSGS